MNIIEVGDQRRLNLPKDLLELVHLDYMNPDKKFAICSSENGYFLKHIRDIQGCKVIAVVTPDSKGRIIIPQRISEAKAYEVFVLNDNLYLNPVEESPD